MEEDLVDFPDELDTSFFARVSKKRFFYVAMYIYNLMMISCSKDILHV